MPRVDPVITATLPASENKDTAIFCGAYLSAVVPYRTAR